MSQYISLWPWFILAQALGVGTAWLTDFWTWRWRKSRSLVIVVNLLSLNFFLSICFLAFIYVLPIRSLTVAIIFLWFLVATWVQVQQFKISFVSALLGHYFQYSLLVIILGFCVWVRDSLLVRKMGLLDVGPVFVVFVSMALLTNALIALFRPALDRAGRVLREYVSEISSHSAKS